MADGDGSSAVDILTKNFLKLNNVPQDIDLLIITRPRHSKDPPPLLS